MKALLSTFRRALRGLDVTRAVGDAVARMPRGPYRVVAIGKAARAMFEGTRSLDVDDAVVIGPADAGHPLPDARSVRAAKACLDLVAREGDARILVLVSGGASALVCAPAPGVTVAKKRAVTKAMLASGATIQEINVVRKHLSLVKGGGLARAAGTRPIVTLVVSDVIGGSASDVGSGPSVPDESTVAEARALLRRYAPAYAELPLVRTFARTSSRSRARILASPEMLARVMARAIDARVLAPSQADVESVARDYVLRARRMKPGDAFVRAAEPSVVVPKRGGKGGRCSHLAALVARDLPRGVTFAAFATDGVDGASGTAGAIVDSTLVVPADVLARFDTGPLHLAAGTALPMQPTGHNLADLHVLVRR